VVPRQRNWRRQCEAGFTLVESMIIVAVIGVLAAIAVPNFLNYRNKSRLASAIGTGESIRAAFASFATNSPDNLYPAMASITDYATLLTIINRNGGNLKASVAAMGLGVGDYYVIDTDGDGVDDAYSLNLTVLGVPNAMRGKVIQITPTGILKCNAGGTNCQ
jgi:prepilin-type N-terminal cleavage/methylation domain-containing protein